MKRFWLVPLLLLVLFPTYSVLRGQTTTPITITVTDASASVTVPVNLVPAQLAIVSTMQFDVSLPATGLAFVSSANGANLAAGKAVGSNVIAPPTPGGPSTVRVLLSGIGAASQTSVGAGEIVKLTFRGTAGSYTLPVSGIVCSSPAAVIVPSSGTPGSVTIP